MQFITLADYILLPFYLAIIYFIAINFRNRKYPAGHPWRPYFMPGLTVKIVGAIFIGLLYQYYYGGGDTGNYFLQAKVVNESAGESLFKWFKLLLHIPTPYDGEYIEYTSRIFWYYTMNNYLVISITAVVSALSFNTFLPASVIFAALSFTGVWALFRTFARQYPHLVRHIAIAVLFVPSTFIWGSGIFKDTICMFGLCWMIHGAFTMLIERKFSLSIILLTIAGFYVISVIKIYILMSFLPALSLWILFTYSHKIKVAFVRNFLKVAVAGIAVGGFLFVSRIYADELGVYSLENITKTSIVTREWISYTTSEEGSKYDLGEIDPTPMGMLRKFPAAVNVALFRPYIWESRKPIIFLNALEAMLFLFATIKILLAIGPGKAWKAISLDPNIQFALIFTIIFAFAVGISSYNFGTLSRYRIPCLPFFALTLTLIYYQYRPPEDKLLSLR